MAMIDSVVSTLSLGHDHRFFPSTNPVAHIVGTNSGKAGDEASLDAEIITTTGRGIETTYVYIDGGTSNPFANWLIWAAKASDAELPKVHSLSVGAPEGAVGDVIIQRMNTEMAALGVRGVSIVFASGDSGYQPEQKFGAASPYVTSVGGVYNGEMRQSGLQADSLTTGGFAASKHNTAQPWQAAAIASYTKIGGAKKGGGVRGGGLSKWRRGVEGGR
ncbi:unnamed protein product [Prorocentrum cordatum]|uniref:subtilisin n=1 Tax=Prorocentrum cordatum TaxID=2364126 RepID=A0ABN9SQ86_9DINO|nr:unnamed protein product [Polarella glacialis]